MLATQAYSIIVSILLLILAAYSIYVTLHNRKNSKVAKTNRAIANTYVSVCYVDLPSNIFNEIYSMQHVRDLVGKTGDAQEALNKSVFNGLVKETYIPRMKEFTDLQTIEERLKNKNIISEEFEGPKLGWCRSSFIPVDHDDEGRLKSFLYTVQRIQGEVLSLRDQLCLEETLLECVLALSKNTDADSSINQLLSNLVSYHDADRAYIFELDYKNGIASNTYEYCAKNIEPQIQNLQNLKIQEIQMFVNLCKMGVLKLADINYFAKDSAEYKLLEAQGITSIMCVPLTRNGDMIGFIGVDNPDRNRGTDSILKSVSSFVITELEKREYITELYDLSYKDMMTGVYNRHANMRDIGELAGKNPGNIGIVYADVNGLKDTNDKFGHERGDRLIINAANMLKKYYDSDDDKIYRMGGDEFVVICHNVTEDVFNHKYEKLVDDLGQDSILSTGKSWLASCTNINEHIKVAEREMYATKRDYYKAHDRRAGRGA